MSHIWIYSLKNYQGIHIYKDLSGTNLKGFPTKISLCLPGTVVCLRVPTYDLGCHVGS